MLFLIVSCAVGKKPQIIRPPPTSSPAVKGFAMSLNCLATGTPPPMVRWYYIGPIWSEHVKKSIKNDSTYSVYQNGTLIIRNVEARETGFYECTASNLMGRTTRKCKVYIPGKLGTFLRFSGSFPFNIKCLIESQK